MSLQFPFSAIVGQDEMKLAILIAAVDPSVGGVLVFGDRGTGKSTAVRALAAMLPKMKAVIGCRYHCAPEATGSVCEDCKALKLTSTPIKSHLIPVPVVDLLIDVAASGENVVEREGLSVRHPARFVLVGSGNPEDGELRPQLLDRFGLSVEVRTPTDLPSRVKVVRRRDEFERDPSGFTDKWKKEDERVRRSIVKGKAQLAEVVVPDAALERAEQLCMALGTDGLRGAVDTHSRRPRARRATGRFGCRRCAPEAGRPADVATPRAPRAAAHQRRTPARRATDRGAVERLVSGTGSVLYAKLVDNPGHVAGALAMMANWDVRPLIRDRQRSGAASRAGEKGARAVS